MMKFLCGKKFYISLKARKRLLKMTSFFLAFVMFVSAIPLHNFVKAEGTAHETTTYDAASVKVVDEMKSLRTETTKTFKKLDGTYEVAYYDQPIHYVLDGKWVNIDNSLMDEGNDELGNQANDFKIKLPKQITENKQIKIKKDQYELSWNVVGIQKASSEVIEQELSKDIRILNDINQRIFYRDVFDGVDLEYLIEGDKVKENFIMKQYIEDFSVTMELSVKDLVLIEDESIKFVDEEGNTIFDISDYIMYDASGKLSSDISVSIIQKNESEYTLTLKPNDDFMKEASYPLVIDPTISIKNDETIKYIKDGFISGTTLNTTGNFLRVGNRDNVNNRTYIGVDLSLITDKPVITYARLELPQYILNGVVQNTCTSCQINVKEVPNITFGMLTDTTQPSSSEIEDYMNVNGNYFNYYWDISKLVQRWKHDGKTEGLLEISDQNNYTSKYIDFKSVEYDNIKPKISIGYVETVGLYDYWTYHSQSAGSAGVGYTNDYTGNLTFIYTDYVASSGKLSFSIQHIFDNQSKSKNIGFGNGYRLNFNEAIEYDPDVDDYYLVDGDGSIVYFDTKVNSQNVAPGYRRGYAEDGSGLLLDINHELNDPSAIKEVKITSKNQIEKPYENNGALSTITDLTTNETLTIYYKDLDKYKIDSIVDSEQNEARFIYENGLLKTLEIYRQDFDETTQERLGLVKDYIIEYHYTNDRLDLITESNTTIKRTYKKQALTEQATYKPVEKVPVPIGLTPSADGEDYRYVYTGEDVLEKQYKKQVYIGSYLEDTGKTEEGVTMPESTTGFLWYDSGDDVTQTLYKKQYKDTYYTWELSGKVQYTTSSFPPTGDATHMWIETDSFTEYQYKKQVYKSVVYILPLSRTTCIMEGYLYDGQCKDYTYDWVDMKSAESYYQAPVYQVTAPIATPNTTEYRWVTTGLSQIVYKYEEEVRKTNWYWRDMTSSDTYYEAPQWKTSTPTATPNTTSYKWISTGSTRIANVYKEQRWTLPRWEDMVSTEEHYEAPIYKTSTPTATPDANYRWVETGLTRISNIYQKEQIVITTYWKDMVGTDINYEAPKEDKFPPLSSDELYRWVLMASSVVTTTVVNTSSYTYYPDGNFETAKSDNENLIKYLYTNGKVISIENYSSSGNLKNALSIAYGFKDTKFTDIDGNFIKYTFDTYGHTITLLDNLGNAKYYKYNYLIDNSYYEPDLINFNLNHKLIEESTLQKTILNPSEYVDERVNLIVNGSFENGLTNWSHTYETVVTPNNEVIYNDVLGNNALQVPDSKRVSQVINESGVAGDYFVFGGWLKGKLTSNNMTLKSTEIKMTTYFMNDVQESFVLLFNNTTLDWQYLMSGIKTTKDYDSIIIELIHSDVNSVLFDGIQLYKDRFGTTYGYDDMGNLSTVDSKSSGQTVSYVYNAQNEIESITDMYGQKTYYSYGDDVLVDSIIRNNVRQSFEYNENGQVKSFTLGNINTDYFTRTTSYQYGNQYVYEETDEFGNTVTYRIDPVKGLVNQFINADNVKTDYDYDPYGRLIKVSKDNAENKYYYENERLVYIQVGELVYKMNYNNDTLTSVQIGKFDSNGVFIEAKTLMSYDYVEKYVGGKTYYTDLLNSQTYGNGDIISFSYNDEKQIETISFNGTPRFEYQYDQGGNLATYKETLNGQTTTYTYHYDLLGRLKSVSDGTDEITYDYNDQGNLAQKNYDVASFMRSVQFIYQTNGQYDKTTYQVNGNTVTKDYIYIAEDEFERLQNIQMKIGTTVLFTETLGYSNHQSGVINGNASTRVNSISYSFNGGYTYSYQFDKLGNITDITVVNGGLTVESYHYEYDHLNQLIREDNKTGNFTAIYSYDGKGNIESKFYYQYQPQVSTTNISGITAKKYVYLYANSPWQDQVTSIEYYENDAHIKTIIIGDYDDSGNPLSYDGWSLVYEGRSIVSANKTGSSITYRYNDQGIRTSKITTKDGVTKTTTYELEGDRVISETTNGVTIFYTYDIDNTLISMNYNGNEYFYIRNLQGDIVKLVDISGNVVVLYSYDAFGNIIETKEFEYDSQGNKLEKAVLDIAKVNPYRYRGYRFDEETSWYYLNSRYYNSEFGRFINADGQLNEGILGKNMYAYTKNNPVMYDDPSGFSEDSTLARLAHLCAGGSTLNYLPEAPVSRWQTNLLNDISKTEFSSHYNGSMSNLNYINVTSSIVVSPIKGAGNAASSTSSSFGKNTVGAAQLKKPINFTPDGTGRNGAFRAAKRDFGIPMSEQPYKVTNAIDKRGNIIPGRDYYFSNGRVIREHFGHSFPDGFSLGNHFNGLRGWHYFY